MSNAIQLNLDTALLEKLLCDSNGELKPHFGNALLADFSERYLNKYAKKVFEAALKDHLDKLFADAFVLFSERSCELRYTIKAKFALVIREYIRDQIICYAKDYIKTQVESASIEKLVREAVHAKVRNAVEKEAAAMLSAARKAMRQVVNEEPAKMPGETLTNKENSHELRHIPY